MDIIRYLMHKLPHRAKLVVYTIVALVVPGWLIVAGLIYLIRRK